MPENTPAPTPSRANYGFALYLGSWTAFGLYLIWSFVPECFLQNLGLSYWPQKYWAVSIPVHMLITLVLFAFCFYPAINMTLVPPMDDMQILTDKYSFKHPPVDNCRRGGIPEVSDIPMSEVCKMLYSKRQQM